ERPDITNHPRVKAAELAAFTALMGQLHDGMLGSFDVIRQVRADRTLGRPPRPDRAAQRERIAAAHERIYRRVLQAADDRPTAGSRIGAPTD
ncbi:MAG: hypothetical protein ABWZ98_15465, partial [Nakamurella sp.]